MRKSIVFFTVAVIVVGILFGLLSFILFEPTQVYDSREKQSKPVNPEEKAVSSPLVPNSTASPSVASSLTGSVVNSPSTLSLADVAKHTSQTDCWVGYNDKAYDITSFLPNHPGGTGAIARYCGTSSEFQDAFMKKHGTSKATMFMKVTVYKGELA